MVTHTSKQFGDLSQRSSFSNRNSSAMLWFPMSNSFWGARLNVNTGQSEIAHGEYKLGITRNIHISLTTLLIQTLSCLHVGRFGLTTCAVYISLKTILYLPVNYLVRRVKYPINFTASLFILFGRCPRLIHCPLLNHRFLLIAQCIYQRFYFL